MKRTAILLSALALGFSGIAEAQTTVKVAWCARTVSSAEAPYAIATKMGWFAKDGIKVEVVPMPGSTDCTKAVATKCSIARCRTRSTTLKRRVAWRSTRPTCSGEPRSAGPEGRRPASPC